MRDTCYVTVVERRTARNHAALVTQHVSDKPPGLQQTNQLRRRFLRAAFDHLPAHAFGTQDQAAESRCRAPGRPGRDRPRSRPPPCRRSRRWRCVPGVGSAGARGRAGSRPRPGSAPAPPRRHFRPRRSPSDRPASASNRATSINTGQSRAAARRGARLPVPSVSPVWPVSTKSTGPSLPTAAASARVTMLEAGSFVKAGSWFAGYQNCLVCADGDRLVRHILSLRPADG